MNSEQLSVNTKQEIVNSIVHSSFAQDVKNAKMLFLDTGFAT